MPTDQLPTGALWVRVHRDRPFYEAKWRHKGKQVSRRIGPAWLEADGKGGWKPRRGRVRDGFYDEKRAHVRMAELITAHAEQASRAPTRKGATFDDAAAEWFDHLSRAGRAK